MWHHTYFVNCDPGLHEVGKLCFKRDSPSASKSSKAFNLLGFSDSVEGGDVPATKMFHQSIIHLNS